MTNQQAIPIIESVLNAYNTSTEYDKENKFYRKVWMNQNDIAAIKYTLEILKKEVGDEMISVDEEKDPLEAAKAKFFAEVQKAKDELKVAYIEVLESVGMYEVDVIRKHDRKKGRILIANDSRYITPVFQFHPYNRWEKISNNISGHIPNKGDIKSFLINMYEVVK